MGKTRNWPENNGISEKPVALLQSFRRLGVTNEIVHTKELVLGRKESLRDWCTVLIVSPSKSSGGEMADTYV